MNSHRFFAVLLIGFTKLLQLGALYQLQIHRAGIESKMFVVGSMTKNHLERKQ